MNRSMAYVGIAVVAAGFALVAFPIVATGAEVFDFEQEAGLFVLPAGLAIILLGLVAHDPRATTVGGAFGNVEESARRPRASAPAARAPVGYNPKEPVSCRYCRTYIPWDVAICPRCARAEGLCDCAWLPEGAAPLEPTTYAVASE